MKNGKEVVCGWIRSRWVGLLLLATSLCCTAPAANGEDIYVIGWNDLGMHCMNQDYASLCVLPPYNNLHAQVVLRGDPPKLITSGVELEYHFINNTSSANKVNFWSNVQALFGVSLAPDIGLAGKGLVGTMDFSASHTLFQAEGVPITPFEDDAPTVEKPYQLAEVRLTSGSMLLDSTTFVAPVSVEMRCNQCHEPEDGETVDQAILRLHDEENETNLSGQQPVLCAKCHASNALGTTGIAEAPNLSLAMHGKHADERPDADCYSCHPGSQTQCLRDAMYIAGKRCNDCHGDLPTMARKLEAGRNPWFEEPRCTDCHAQQFGEEPGKLYRMSKGHGGLLCEACHNSPHAILPTVEPKDSLQVQRLQGAGGTLKVCSVCHTKRPTEPGPHGIVAPPETAVQKDKWFLY